MRKYILLLLLITILLSGCGKHESPPIVEIPGVPEQPEAPKAPPVDPIEEKIKKMNLEEKIGQLIIVGLEGTELNDYDKVHIKDNKIGGFILFSRNIENKDQVINLLNSLKEENEDNKLPLFLSVDEEGGLVSRLSKIYANLSAAANLGRKNDDELSYEYGENLGIKLNSLGFNLDFAPVLDINSNPKNPVIGKRAYGTTANIVVQTGLAVMEGIRSQNIIPVAKHFPGHGDTDTDSHLDLPRIDKSLNELEGLELIPFKAAIDNGLDMIMVAHILYPQIDGAVPATMSDTIIDEILRKRLGFDGVVISDDMTMGAITDNYSVEEAATKFIISGGDIVLVCHGSDNPRLVIDRIKASIDSGEISMDEIDKKVYRIIRLKNKYNIERDNKIDISKEELNSMTTVLNNKLK